MPPSVADTGVTQSPAGAGMAIGAEILYLVNLLLMPGISIADFAGDLSTLQQDSTTVGALSFAPDINRQPLGRCAAGTGQRFDPGTWRLSRARYLGGADSVFRHLSREPGIAWRTGVGQNHGRAVISLPDY